MAGARAGEGQLHLRVRGLRRGGQHRLGAEVASGGEEKMCIRDRYHLAHIFKDMTGMSPIHYMIRCRIGEAQNLLISTDYSATQIRCV